MKDPLYSENLELNRIITTAELQEVIRKARNGKSAGIDKIPYMAS